jgi:hypothetical protein
VTPRVFWVLIAFVLTVGWSADSLSQSKEPVLAAHNRVYVDGKQMPANRVIVKDGASYVEVTALAEAAGATVQPGSNGWTMTTQPRADCDKIGGEGERFSEQFRSDVAGVADEIESLRAVVLKKEKVPLGPRFDAIDAKLKLSETHVQTDADGSVYYALSFSNNSLAIAYYKQLRGASPEEAQKDQLDSMMCAMESKFALMKGVLLPGGSCSVFKRLESQPAVKKDEASQ